MKETGFVPFLLIALFTGGITTGARAQFAYPSTRTVDSSNTYFGKSYTDPYRWLENIGSPEVERWFKQQAGYTNTQLSKLNGRDELIAEWKMLDKIKPSTISNLVIENGRVFYRKTLAGESVGKLYYRQGLAGTEILLFDPLTFTPGKKLSLQDFLPSYDGKMVALSYSRQGAEVSTIRILNVTTRTMLADAIYPTRGLTAWTFDNSAFMYTSLKSDDAKDPQAFLSSKIKLHLISRAGNSGMAHPVTARSSPAANTDKDFFSDASYPSLGIQPRAYPYAFVDEFSPSYVFSGSGTVEPEYTMFYAPVSGIATQLAWKILCTPADSLVSGLEVVGDQVFAISHDHASNYKLVSTSLSNPDWKIASLIAAEKHDMTLKSLGHSKDYLFLNYSDGINSHLYKYSLSAKTTTEVRVPLAGSISIECVDKKANYSLIGITSWNKPFTEYVYNPVTETFSPSPFNKPVIYPAKYMDLDVREVQVRAADGAMIPLSIVFKKGTKLDGSNVCLLEGYGAYGITLDPHFSVMRNALVTKDVVYAVAHVRGGGEKGQSWYKGGYKITKRNTWKDFNACAEYLINQKYTSPARLAGWGTSAGGILISRAITERPELYAAAMCNVGCANAMRLEFSANGPVNIPEFGTVKDSAECKALYEMDGMQHVVKGVKYPAILSVGGWNDPRVAAWQPAKFAAAMQLASNSGKPVLIKINYDNGHFTEDKDVTFANFADQLAFAMWQCGHPGFQPKKQMP